jgi:hypothetical protein
MSDRGLWNTGKNTSLILANLTPIEYDRVMRARIPFSGATGRNATEKEYPETGAYIATTVEYLLDAVHALKWKNIKLTATDLQIIARHFHTKEHFFGYVPNYPPPLPDPQNPFNRIEGNENKIY